MKKIFVILVLFFVFSLLVFLSCSKRSRLTSSTLVLSILPTSVSLAPEATQTFTVSGKTAKTDNPDIDPEWSVTPSTLGTLNKKTGKEVVFTAGSSAGTGKIIAQEGDVKAEASITVSASAGGGSSDVVLSFYNDSGLVNTFGTPDIFVWSEDSSLSISEERSDGDGAPGDVNKYQRIGDDNSSWFGAGIVINKVGEVQNPVNLSSYASSSNSLRFYIRLSRGLTDSEKIKVEIEHTSSTKETVYLDANYGFNKDNTSWQEITIPLTSFSGVDYTQVLLPFEITAENITSHLTFDWDNVRWTK